MNIDEWFKKIREKYRDQMQCGKGCTACCYGLFDITLADAVDVARGFQSLPRKVQEQVFSRASALHRKIRDAATDLPEPTILAEDDTLLDTIVDAVDIAPCPCLGDAGECLIYEKRPVACRLEGVPMVDFHEGPFGDWCELNFNKVFQTKRWPICGRTTIASIKCRKPARPRSPNAPDSRIITQSRSFLPSSPNTRAFGSTRLDKQRLSNPIDSW